jgi:integrase
VTELTSRDVEAYLDRKLAENRRIEAARAIGEPLIDGRGRALQALRPQTINSHLHLLAEILARAVREGLLARNPAEGEDLRLEARREKKHGLELDEAMALVEATGTLDQRPAPSDALRRRILDMRAAGTAWRVLAADLGIAESTAIYHANRVAARPLPRYRPVIATLTLAGLRVSELCALNCEHVDLARRELRILDAKTPAGVRRVDIHDDLQEELAAYKAARRRVAARDARVPQRPRQALDTQRDRPARAPPRSEGGQPAARGRRSAADPRAGHPTHAPLHVHRVAVRRRRRPGVRGRPGRARRHHDDQPHLPVRAAAAAARRDRPSAAAGDARVRHEVGRAKLSHSNVRGR